MSTLAKARAKARAGLHCTPTGVVAASKQKSLRTSLSSLASPLTPTSMELKGRLPRMARPTREQIDSLLGPPTSLPAWSAMTLPRVLPRSPANAARISVPVNTLSFLPGWPKWCCALSETTLLSTLEMISVRALNGSSGAVMKGNVKVLPVAVGRHSSRTKPIG